LEPGEIFGMAPAKWKRMKTKKVIYWISTILVCAMMAMVSFAYLTHEPKMAEAFRTLGYPPYFQNILGAAKILGVITLLAPGFALLKEWAYAGFTFTFIGAFISHLVMGQNQEALMPVISLVLLGLSYSLRPATRRLSFATRLPNLPAKDYPASSSAHAHQSTGA
jgi:DoxX-like family